MKNILLLPFLLMLVTVSNSLAQSISFNGSNNYVNITNHSSLHLKNFTLEAWVKITGVGATTGTAISSGEGGFKASTVVPIIAKGRREKGSAATAINYFFGYRASDMKLVADFEDNVTAAHHPVVGNMAIPTNTWIHVAVSYATTGTWKLYINGNVDKTLVLGASYIPQSLSNVVAAIGSTLNSKRIAEGFFKGQIDEVRIWNVVRSDLDIYDNHKLELTSGSGLIARYGFNEGSGTITANTISSLSNGTLVNNPQWSITGYQESIVNLPPNAPSNPSPADGIYVAPTSTALCVAASDPDNIQLRVRFYGRKKNKTGKFTVILLPDTQFYTREPQSATRGNNSFFKLQTSWVASNRATRNIAYVGHLGDIVEHGDSLEIEWQRANEAMSTLEDPVLTGLSEGIPYGLCVGNHDMTPQGQGQTGTTNFYNQYFGISRFTGRTYYGGHYGTNNDNHYGLFSAGNIDFLVLSPKWGSITSTITGVLDWMENLVQAYPNRKVIVTSHFLLNGDSTTSFHSQGYYIYNRLKIYPNLILMAGGHDTRPNQQGEARRSDTYNGNIVHTTLQDYQARVNGGNSLLRIYEFDSVNNNVEVRTYSPYTNTYETDSNSLFNLNVKLSSGNTWTPNPFTLIGELNNVASGSTACIDWTNLESNEEYEWYAEVYDGRKAITGSIWAFTTKESTTGLMSNYSNIQAKEITSLPPSNSLFNLYPNPNSGYINLSFPNDLKGLYSVEVYDTGGKLHLRKVFTNPGIKISFEHKLSAGNYLVIVKGANSQKVGKLVVIK
jgi:hypothetical protein